LLAGAVIVSVTISGLNGFGVGFFWRATAPACGIGNDALCLPPPSKHRFDCRQ
jgi:hypothetical protein